MVILEGRTIHELYIGLSILKQGYTKFQYLLQTVRPPDVTLGFDR